MSALHTSELLPAAQPMVSIGLPVYNGADYLAEAVSSILEQSFTDFELIICDNASQDATQQLCETFAAQDPRIRYVRNPANLGAGPNYDLCFSHARGKYFKWAAHDDTIRQDFLEKAVAMLEGHPEAVLCGIGVREIGPLGEPLRSYASPLRDCAGQDRLQRFSAVLLSPHSCTDFFGLIRHSALVGSQLHGDYDGSDRGLLTELALRGSFVFVDEIVFFNRDHPSRFSRAVYADRADTSYWLNTAKRRGSKFRNWVLWNTYLKFVQKYVPSAQEKLKYYAVLARWPFADYNGRGLIGDLLFAVNPRLKYQVQRLKRRLVGSRPRAQGAEAGSAGEKSYQAAGGGEKSYQADEHRFDQPT